MHALVYLYFITCLVKPGAAATTAAAVAFRLKQVNQMHHLRVAIFKSSTRRMWLQLHVTATAACCAAGCSGAVIALAQRRLRDAKAAVWRWSDLRVYKRLFTIVLILLFGSGCLVPASARWWRLR